MTEQKEYHWQQKRFLDRIERNPILICSPEIWAWDLQGKPYRKKWGCGWFGEARDATVKEFEHKIFRCLYCPECGCPELDELEIWEQASKTRPVDIKPVTWRYNE